jgi:predicted phage-related endonuclease
MRTTIPKPADRVEWLEARRHYVGASEAAALVAQHPYLSLGDLAAEKLTGVAKPETPAMRRGRYLEHAIALWYADQFGCALEEPSDLYVYDEVLIATLDRVIVGEPVVVEIKSVRGRCISEPLRYWYHQAQVQLMASGFDRVLIVCLDDSDELKVFTIEPDAEIQALLVEAAHMFLAYVRRGEIPPGIALPYQAAATLHPTVERQAVDLDDDTARSCRALVCLQSRIRDLEADEDQLKGMIGHRLGDAAEGRYDGHTIVTWRQTTRTTIDAKRLRFEHPDIANDCTTTSTYRQLRTVTP